MKLKIGQTIYSLNIGNLERNVEQKLTPMIVNKIGRKYFHASPIGWNNMSTTFHIEDLKEKSDYMPEHKIYLNELEWEEDKLKQKLNTELKEYFNIYSTSSLSIDAMQKILTIIKDDLL